MLASKSKERLSSRHGWQALRHFIYATPIYHLTLRAPVPEGLNVLPPGPWPGDPQAADTMMSGGLIQGGIRRSFGENPWLVDIEDEDYAAFLHGFDWLADLRALGSPTARTRGQELVLSWIQKHGRWSDLFWRPDVLGRRLSNWLSSHKFLWADAEEAGCRQFLQSMAGQARHLAREFNSAPRDSRAFSIIKGLIHVGVCLPGYRSALDAGLLRLEHEIARQILPDGGHFQRNPSLHMWVLRNFVDIREALVMARAEIPTTLQGAIDRMAPMLRGYRLGDGGLALFNGSHEEDRRMIDTVLAQAGAKGKALSSAPHTGFQRLSAERTVVLVDSGAPLSGDASRMAHAGILSFEMSVGKTRLIVNCGAYSGCESGWRAAARSTAAHSTLCVCDTNSLEITEGGESLHRSRHASCTRKESAGSVWLETSHEGYKENLGVTHQRKLYLESSGKNFRGEDILTGPAGRDFAVRFHVHPLVKASLVGDGSAVILKPPSGGGWRFRAKGGVIGVEESIYMGQPGPPRRSEQITVSGCTGHNGADVKWAFSREG